MVRARKCMVRTGAPIKRDASWNYLYRCSDSPSFPHAFSGIQGTDGDARLFLSETQNIPSKLTDSSDLADPRQLLAEQNVHNPRAADSGFHQHHTRTFTNDFADHLSVVPKRMFAHALQQPPLSPTSQSQELTFIGHVERVQAENFASSLNGSRTGMCRSSMTIPTFEDLAISLSVVATPPRVGSRRQWIAIRVKQVGDQGMERAVSLSIVLSNSKFSRCDMIAMPWSPMVPLKRILSPGRARSAEIRTELSTMPNPVVVMKILSPLPRFTTFVSPVTSSTPASFVAALIDLTTRYRSSVANPSSKNKCRGNVERLRSAHGQVVNRAVNGQIADIAAGKKNRRNHERIGGERRSATR